MKIDAPFDNSPLEKFTYKKTELTKDTNRIVYKNIFREINTKDRLKDRQKHKTN